jgi:hypothetical protein
MTPALTALAQDIETALKGALKQAFEMGYFRIRFGHDTVQKLNEALEAIGLSVYAMNYADEAICITLRLSHDMTEGGGNNLFHYCQFCIANDGDFIVDLDDAALDEGLNVRLTTPYDQPLFTKATTAEIDGAANNIRNAFQTRLLKA